MNISKEKLINKPGGFASFLPQSPGDVGEGTTL